MSKKHKTTCHLKTNYNSTILKQINKHSPTHASIHTYQLKCIHILCDMLLEKRMKMQTNSDKQIVENVHSREDHLHH